MSKSFLQFLSFIVGLSLVLTMTSYAQDVPIEAPIEITNNTPLKKSKIIRNVEPVPYWVDADQLRIRDTPVVGDVIDMLELGQKIKAYEQFENWIRISKTSSNAKWVNTDYLTNTPITWARYGNNATRRIQRRAGLGNNSVLKRIKVEGDKSARIYAALITENANGNRIIVTRQNFRAGPYFEKRLVACSENIATHVQMLGEGYTYIMMENDIRGNSIDINSATPSLSILESDDLTATTLAVANYSCDAEI